MQLFFEFSPAAFSLLAQAATPAPGTAEGLLKQVHDNQGAFGLGALILAAVAGQVWAIISNWIASKAVAGEEGTFVNGFKVWAFYLLAMVGVGVVVGLAIPIMAKTAGGASVIIFALGAFLLVILLGFLIPMKVYEIGFLGALGFLVLTFIIQMIGGFGLSLAIVGNQTKLREITLAYLKLPPAEQQKFMTQLFHQGPAAVTAAAVTPPADALPGEAVAGDVTKSIPERAAGLKTMYDELRKRMAALPPGDAAAAEAYNRANGRYNQLLKAVQADAAKSPKRQ